MPESPPMELLPPAYAKGEDMPSPEGGFGENLYTADQMRTYAEAAWRAGRNALVNELAEAGNHDVEAAVLRAVAAERERCAGVDLSAFRQGNWEHPDHKGRIVGWLIPNDAVKRMGADAFCLPREIAEALTRLAAIRIT